MLSKTSITSKVNKRGCNDVRLFVRLSISLSITLRVWTIIMVTFYVNGDKYCKIIKTLLVNNTESWWFRHYDQSHWIFICWVFTKRTRSILISSFLQKFHLAILHNFLAGYYIGWVRIWPVAYLRFKPPINDICWIQIYAVQTGRAEVRITVNDESGVLVV